MAKDTRRKCIEQTMDLNQIPVEAKSEQGKALFLPFTFTYFIPPPLMPKDNHSNLSWYSNVDIITVLFLHWFC